MADLWAGVLAVHFIGRRSSSLSGNIAQWRWAPLRTEEPVGGRGLRVWRKANGDSLCYSLDLPTLKSEAC